MNRKVISEVKIDNDKHAALYKSVNIDDTSGILDYACFVRVKNDGVYVKHSTGNEFKIFNPYLEYTEDI